MPVDFSKTSLMAIKCAASMLHGAKGELILLHVQKKKDILDLLIPALREKDLKKIMEHISEKLNKLSGEIKKKYDVKVSAIQADGGITSKIVEVSRKNKVGLIVMGTHGKDSGNDFFLGSNSYRVLTKSSVPVMTVLKGKEKSGFSKILIPIDSSEHSRQKVNSALSLAQRFDAELYVQGLYHKHEEEYFKYKLEVILDQIQKLSKEKNVVCQTAMQVSKNHAVSVLERAKQEKADMIVAMTDQNTEFSSIILGTYIHQIINEATVPVLCIPPQINEDNIESTLGGLW